MLGTFPKGWSVPLTYRRDGKETEITVRLAGLLTPEELNDKATKAFGEEKPKVPMPKREAQAWRETHAARSLKKSQR